MEDEFEPEIEELVRFVTFFVANQRNSLAELNEIGCAVPVALSYLSFLLVGSIALLRRDLDDDEVLEMVWEVSENTLRGPLLNFLLGPGDDPLDVILETDTDTITAFRTRCSDSPVLEAAEIYTELFMEQCESSREAVFSAFADVGERYFAMAREAVEAGLHH